MKAANLFPIAIQSYEHKEKGRQPITNVQIFTGEMKEYTELIQIVTHLKNKLLLLKKNFESEV